MIQRALEQCGDLPWCQEDPAKLGSVISDFSDRYDAFLAAHSERWFENYQYIYGNHDVVWSKRYGVPLDNTDFLRRSGGRSLNSRSQTNASRTAFESLSSLLFSRPPDWECAAADDSRSAGRRTKKMLEKLLDCYYERLSMTTEIRQFVNNFVAYGISASKIDWNVAGGRIVNVPQLREEMVPVYTSVAKSADPLGLIQTVIADETDPNEPRMEKRMVPIRDASGKPLSEDRWCGDARVQILTPFEFARETNPQGSHKAKWFRHLRIMDYDDFLMEYGEMDGRTAYMDRTRPGLFSKSAYSFALRHFIRMQFVQPITQRRWRREPGYRVQHDLLKSKVLVTEWYDRPNPILWPKGRLVVTVNGFCTHITRPQYHFDGVGGWHPFVEANWLTLNPSPMPTGPMNDITAKNKELDTLDSLIDTSTYRNLGSMVLLKAGAGINEQDINGTPGQVLTVSDPLSSVAFVRDPVPVPPIIPQLREMKKEDIYELSGAQEGIRGDRSRGISSGYQQKLQEEREQKRLTPQRMEIEKAVAEMGKKLTACIQQNCGTLDEDVAGFLKRSAAGEFDEQDIAMFLEKPIGFGVDVKVKEGSMQAKSQAAEDATLIELVTKTPAASRLQDAGVMDEFLVRFNAQVLRDGSSVHRDRARKENETFSDLGQLGPDATGVQMPFVLWSDDDEIHITAHERDMVENADDLRHDSFEFMVRQFHIEYHKMQSREKRGELPPGTTAEFTKIQGAVLQNPKKSLGDIVGSAAQRQELERQKAAQGGPQGPAGGAPQGGQPPAPGGAPQGAPSPSQPAASTPAGQATERRAAEVGGPRA